MVLNSNLNYIYPAFRTTEMKTEIVKWATLMCMIIVLGVQELLRGSWKVPDMKIKDKGEKQI